MLKVKQVQFIPCG